MPKQKAETKTLAMATTTCTEKLKKLSEGLYLHRSSFYPMWFWRQFRVENCSFSLICRKKAMKAAIPKFDHHWSRRRGCELRSRLLRSRWRQEIFVAKESVCFLYAFSLLLPVCMLICSILASFDRNSWSQEMMQVLVFCCWKIFPWSHLPMSPQHEARQIAQRRSELIWVLPPTA